MDYSWPPAAMPPVMSQDPLQVSVPHRPVWVDIEVLCQKDRCQGWEEEMMAEELSALHMTSTFSLVPLQPDPNSLTIWPRHHRVLGVQAT